MFVKLVLNPFSPNKIINIIQRNKYITFNGRENINSVWIYDFLKGKKM